MFGIDGFYYEKIYDALIALLCIIIFIYFSFSNSNVRIHGEKGIITGHFYSFILISFVIIFIGLRPLSRWFVDMHLYDHVYNNIYGDNNNVFSDSRGEWLFYLFGMTCKKLGLSSEQYFLSIAIIYFGLMYLACRKLMYNNLFLALLFCLSSFSCFSYATNGLRNGMACSIVMLAVSLLSEDNWKKILAFILMFCAYSIHHSTALPSICAISALLLVKDIKWAIYFWIASIFISLVAGNLVTELFVNLGLDDRMEQYANLEELQEPTRSDQLSSFRIDFIIYSIMPIILAWYVSVKRNFKDLTYHIIATTYILANAFWIMVIRSEQSNRFAYLSWFLYPLVIAYPLLRMNIWDDQDRKTAFILLVYSGFTFFMTFVYYG